jgi:hypothetical protein
MTLALPEPMGRGKVTAERRAKNDAEVKAWCQALLELKPSGHLDRMLGRAA